MLKKSNVNPYVVPGITSPSYAEVQDVMEVFEKQTVFTAEQYRSNDRKKDRRTEIATLRHLLCVFLYRYVNINLTQIGKELGGRNHATVLHGIGVAEGLMETSQSYKQLHDKIDKELGCFREVVRKKSPSFRKFKKRSYPVTVSVPASIKQVKKPKVVIPPEPTKKFERQKGKYSNHQWKDAYEQD